MNRYQYNSRLIILDSIRQSEFSLHMANTPNQSSSEQETDVTSASPKFNSNSVNRKVNNKKKGFPKGKKSDFGNKKSGGISRNTSPERSSATPFSMANHSTGNVATIFINRGVIQQPYRNVVQQTINFDFTVSPIVKRLEKQADVWARRIIACQNLQLRDTLGPKQDTWYKKLFSAYIYSYYKCLLYGIFDSIAEPLENSTCVVKGHNLLYSVVKQSKFVFRYKDTSVLYNFRIDDVKIDSILKAIKDSNFNFINDNLFKSTYKFSLFNAECERHLKDLNNMLGNSGPLFTLLDDSSVVSQYLTQDNFPLCNSFYDQELNEVKWYYTSYLDVPVLSQSVLIGKALFISTLSKDKDILQYYVFNNQDDENSLVKYEVTSVAGFDYPDFTNGSVK